MELGVEKERKRERMEEWERVMGEELIPTLLIINPGMYSGAMSGLSLEGEYVRQ